MCLPNVLVSIGRQHSKVFSRDYFAEDRFRPLLACLVLVLDLKVLTHKARRRLHDLNDLVLQDK